MQQAIQIFAKRKTATCTVRYLAIAAALLVASPVSAQRTSPQTAIGMTATVLPNLKLEPRVFAVEDAVVTARLVPEGPDGFRIHVQTNGGGQVILQIPVWLSANVKTFILSASTSRAAMGTVRMVSAQSESITVLSSHKPLHSSSIFALGLPGVGRRSAAGTLSGTIEIAFPELPPGETKAFSIRVSISQNCR